MLQKHSYGYYSWAAVSRSRVFRAHITTCHTPIGREPSQDLQEQYQERVTSVSFLNSATVKNYEILSKTCIETSEKEAIFQYLSGCSSPAIGPVPKSWKIRTRKWKPRSRGHRKTLPIYLKKTENRSDARYTRGIASTVSMVGCGVILRFAKFVHQRHLRLPPSTPSVLIPSCLHPDGSDCCNLRHPRAIKSLDS